MTRIGSTASEAMSTAAPPAMNVKSRAAKSRTPGRATARSTTADGTSIRRMSDICRRLLGQPGLNGRNRCQTGAGDDNHADPHPRHLARCGHNEEGHRDEADERLSHGDELVARGVSLRCDGVEGTGK